MIEEVEERAAAVRQNDIELEEAGDVHLSLQVADGLQLGAHGLVLLLAAPGLEEHGVRVYAFVILDSVDVPSVTLDDLRCPVQRPRLVRHLGHEVVPLHQRRGCP